MHFYHEKPLCAANWYVEQLGMELPPVRDSSGVETPRKAWDPCDVPYGEAGWPSLEPIGTIRQPSGGVRFGNGSMSWYPRQCVSDRCGRDQPLVPSRGQALDHVAFTVENLDALIARLRTAKVKVLEGPYTFGGARAFMIEDPDGLAIELIDRASGPPGRDAMTRGLSALSSSTRNRSDPDSRVDFAHPNSSTTRLGRSVTAPRVSSQQERFGECGPPRECREASLLLRGALARPHERQYPYTRSLRARTSATVVRRLRSLPRNRSYCRSLGREISAEVLMRIDRRSQQRV
jgi:catechol 2,3-dioxygenase-like lactoylglutathione lyase family enzyme